MPNPVISDITVVPKRDKYWHVTNESGAEVFRSAERSVAIRKGRTIARCKHGQLVVKKRDGKLDFAEDFAAVER